jgi:hypothetical protein
MRSVWRPGTSGPTERRGKLNPRTTLISLASCFACFVALQGRGTAIAQTPLPLAAIEAPVPSNATAVARTYLLCHARRARAAWHGGTTLLERLMMMAFS